jgi:hypothetical protein
MKIQIEPNTVSFDNLKTLVVKLFPDYKITVTKNNHLLIKKNFLIACRIILRRKRILFYANFPDIRMILTFRFLIILNGIFLPLIIYGLTLRRKFNEFEKEICDALFEKL